MNGANLTDLALLVPELILVGTALVLMLAAQRIQKAHGAAVVTLLAAIAAGIAAFWTLGDQPRTGFGGMITLDGYSQFFKVLIAAAVSLVTLLSARRIDSEHVRPAEYHVLLLLAATGMMFATSALDLLILYLSLELMTLCANILVGITVQKPTANEAAIKYFLLGSFASALMLYGIALVYGVTGATDFAGIAGFLESLPRNLAVSGGGMTGSPILLAAIGLLVAGMAFKIAAVPFHAWAPDAYQGASTPVAAFLASASKAAGLAALGRVCLVALHAEAHVLSMALTGLAALSIVVGSVMALSQTNMKRLLAYSSIGHVGYALLGLISGTSEGAVATMTYVFLYVFMTLGAFGVVIALGERGESLNGYQGLASQRPTTAAFMLLFLLALTGIPPTAGFVAKFVVIQSVVSGGHWELAILAVLASVISAFVYLRVVVLMYMKEPEEPEAPRCPPAVLAVLAIAALVTVIGGIFPGALSLWTVGP